jgi:hypothetical protein
MIIIPEDIHAPSECHAWLPGGPKAIEITIERPSLAILWDLASFCWLGL